MGMLEGIETARVPANAGPPVAGRRWYLFYFILLSGSGDGSFKAIRVKALAQVCHQAVINGFSDGLIVFFWKMIREFDTQQNPGPIGPVPIPVHDLTDDKTVG